MIPVELENTYTYAYISAKNLLLFLKWNMQYFTQAV